jgi:hypothetical protein
VPNIPLSEVGPQRAAPKSVAAINAEVTQAGIEINLSGKKKKNPFIDKLSINKWKVSPKSVIKQLTETGDC